MNLSLGPVPAEEPCVQVSRSTDYLPAMRAEVRRHKAMLEARFPNLPEGVRFHITSNAHDFGTYLDLEVRTNGSNEANAAACFIEDNLPATWDDEQVFPDLI